MRLKLVLICSLIAALIGVGSTSAIILLVFSSLNPVTSAGWAALSAYLIPLLSILVAAYFVYRHTARRRRLQAILTALISLLLTFAIFLLFSIITAPKLTPTSPPAEPPRNVG